jgi:hypothetical protein
VARVVKKKVRTGTNDLGVLHPDRFVLVGNEVWAVREYSLRDAARHSALGTRFLESRKDGGKPDPAAAVYLLAGATGRNAIEIAGLPDSDFDALVAAWDEVNASLFEEKPQPKESMRWADVYEALIAGGHTLSEIGTYTARQIELFLSATVRRRREQRAEDVLDMNVAFNGGTNADKHLESLRKTET